MIFKSIFSPVEQFIWHSESQCSGLKQQLILLLRIFSLVIKDLASGMLSLRAMSLVYTTLLSLVPLIAVSFSVLKGFGVHNQIEPMLAGVLSPLGDKGPEITTQIISFVENMKMGVLGSIGLLMLIYTVISLISKIETAFNFTWRIHSSRSLVKKFSNYLSIVMVGPVMMFAAIGITASLSSHSVIEILNQYETIGQLIRLVGAVLPFIMIIGLFTLLYMIIPNISVSFKSALYGALFAGLMWKFTGGLFADFASGSTNYTAVYSGFAILILFMIWLYLGWLILLTGANIAYYHQHPERLQWDQQHINLSGELREQAMLNVMVNIAKSHTNAKADDITLKYLSKDLNMPADTVLSLIDDLKQGGWIKGSNDKLEVYLPAVSLQLISVADIIRCARHSDNQSLFNSSEPTVQHTMQKINQLVEQQFSSISLASLVKKS